MNFLDMNYYQNKIAMHFSLVDKTNNEQFLATLATFFDFLCEDPIILSLLGQIINQVNKPEQYLEQCTVDASKLLNMYIIECAQEIEKSGKWNELVKFENSIDDKNEGIMLPQSMLKSQELNLTNLREVLNWHTHPFYVTSRMEGLEKVISHFQLNINNISQRVESSYTNWKEPSTGYINLKSIYFDNSLTREQLEKEALSYNSAYEKLRALALKIEFSYEGIETLSTITPKKDLLEIMASLNYEFPYMLHINKLVKNSPCIFKYFKENRAVITNNSMYKDYNYINEWEQKLNRILTQLYTLIDSTWYVNALLDRYRTKIREYGWTRIARLVQEQKLKTNEKLLQFDLAEYLFDHGITTVVEKESGPDRLDIMTFDQGNTIMEVKLFREIDDLTHVFQGVTQTLKYIKSHGKTVGYYVVFQSCKFNSLELVQEFTIGGATIFLLLIDITGINGRDDKRARIDLNYNELHNFISFKDKEFTKQWSDVTLAHLLLIKGIGSTTARNLISIKDQIHSFKDLEGFVNKSQFEELEKYIKF